MVEYLLVHRKDLSVVISKTNKHVRKKYRHFDTQLGILHPGAYYNTTVTNETYAIILLPINMDTDNKFKNYVSILC